MCMHMYMYDKSRAIKRAAAKYIWQDGFKLRDYLKAESDIRLLGDKIAKMNTFLPAP